MVVKTRTNSHNLLFHIVWTTEYTKDIFITRKNKEEMVAIIKSVAIDNEIEIKEIEIKNDYIHVIVSFPPKFSASHVVKTLKGGSAKKWFTLYPNSKEILECGHLWHNNFFIATTGGSYIKDIQNYLDSQVTEYNGGRPRT